LLVPAKRKKGYKNNFRTPTHDALVLAAMVTNFSASPKPKLFMLGAHLIATDIKLCVCEAHNNTP
jgi:hypothetical protein